MMRTTAIRGSILAVIAIACFILPVQAAYAGNVIFDGTHLTHDFKTVDGELFVAIDDLADQLGITILDDGTRLLIGNTINGSVTVDPQSPVISNGNLSIDYGKNLVKEDGVWYVPDTFLVKVLGVKSRLNLEDGNLTLYPVIVAIRLSNGAVRITSSLPPEFDTFELTGPSRRVIDIDNSFLSGRSIEISGDQLGMNGVAALRASQFVWEPPTVRIVLEWENEQAPRHTVFPDLSTLEVLISNANQGSSACSDRNLLNIDSEIVQLVVVLAAAGDENDTEGPELFTIEPAISTTTDPADSTETVTDDELTQEVEPEIQTPPELFGEGRLLDGELIPDIITPDETSAPPGPQLIEYPEGAEDMSLEELGWIVGFEMGVDGEITTTFDVPPFEMLTDFTLAGDGMRLVIDLSGTWLPGNERRMDGIGDIQQIRFGQFQPTTTRLVMDLDRVLAYQVEHDCEEGLITVRILSGDLSGKVIVIDPGHGGEDPGASHFGLQEKDLNLEMSYYLKEFLEENGATVILTRENDVYITLARRIDIAIQVDADLFICVHNNATEEPTAIQGSMIIYQDENYMPLYRLVHRGIAGRTGVPGLGPVPDERGLFILRYAEDIPVLFVEAAFMTNQIDHARLADRSRAYARNIMAGVMDGVLAYYAGRDLPPVIYPDFREDIETGVFDLAGRPIVLPGEDVENSAAGSGSAWDTPGEVDTSDEEDSESEDDSDEDAGDEESDDNEDRDRLRGRGAYRYR